MRRPGRGQAWRRRALLMGLVVGSLVVLVRGFQLQVIEGGRWAARALGQHQEKMVLPAPRGTIYDRNGIPLAVSREVVRVSVAPRELRDRAAVAQRLREVLGLSAAAAARATDPARRWVVLPGRHDASVRPRLEGEPGIYLERVVERSYPHGDVALELIGRVSADGQALGGLELEFDSLLSGRPGAAVARRDARGRSIPGSRVTVVDPVAGRDLVLTLDVHLQEIAEGALRHAIEETDAAGGDLVLADPQTGEILAAVSRRGSAVRSWRAVTEPYEPGSTLKPFLVSALLAEGRAELSDSIFAEEGRYVRGGRTIEDSHPYGWLTLRDALRLSSNIAMAKVAHRLEPEEQYAYLRDFGFGTPTGITYPSEAAGVLRRPDQWSGYSQSSLAIGYEIGVTPLQMVMAYGALANGGVLMEPHLVREVRSRGGRTLFRSEPQPVRRVVPAEVARAVSAVLVDVVEAGTGQAADLGVFRVAGKTGTARRYHAGRYGEGWYTASFAGFFPAADPQLTFLVKLDHPKGTYYGGTAAAPVTRATLAAALAARSTALDRRAVVAAAAESTAAAGPDERARRARAVLPHIETGATAPVAGPFIFAMDARPVEPFAGGASDDRRAVPDVRGLALRDAVRRLHRQGFQVRVEGSGTVRSTAPAAGRSAARGSVVRVRAGGGAS
ncbi:MAG TPA: penicillin-binding transpeptidase domain-containing protein [Longimicrobiales bacterium]